MRANSEISNKITYNRVLNIFDIMLIMPIVNLIYLGMIR
jgi:hypothetical protein